MKNEEKLDIAIKYLKLDTKDISSAFGVSAGYISKIRNPTYNELKPLHLYAFDNYFEIPYRIFEDININTKKKIEEALEMRQDVVNMTTMNQLFIKKESILKQLVGEWYAYLYTSGRKIHEIKTIINEDYSVFDENDNKGELFISEKQSMIIKKSHNSKNLVSLTFNNSQIAFESFHFSLISKRNKLELEMLSFGFMSKTKLTKNKAKSVLGNISKMQLHIDYNFMERV